MNKIFLYMLICIGIPLNAYAQTCLDTSGNIDAPICGGARGDQIIDGDAGVTVKFAAIATDGADSDEVVAAVAGKKIKVLGYLLACSGASNLTWEDGDGTDISGTIEFVANGNLNITAPVTPIGWFETPVANKALNLLSSANVDCDGHITYVEVD